MHEKDFQGWDELKQDIKSSSGYHPSRNLKFCVVVLYELLASGRFV